MNNRIYWVDYVKGIAIILVVYAHVTFGLNRAGIMDDSLFKAPFMMIAVNTMPWFFFLSGLFFYDSLIKRGPLRLIANRLDTIIYPYIIWSIIQGLIEIAFSRWTNNQFESLSAVLSLLWQPRAQLWFLYVLFFIAGVFMPLLVYRGVKYLGLSLLFEIPEGLSTEVTIRRMKATHTKELPKKPYEEPFSFLSLSLNSRLCLASRFLRLCSSVSSMSGGTGVGLPPLSKATKVR